MREEQSRLFWIVEELLPKTHKVTALKKHGNDSTISYQYIHMLAFSLKKKKSSKITFSITIFLKITSVNNLRHI